MRCHHHKLYPFNRVKRSLKSLQNYIVFGFMFHFDNNATNKYLRVSIHFFADGECGFRIKICKIAQYHCWKMFIYQIDWTFGHNITIVIFISNFVQHIFRTIFWFRFSNICPFWLLGIQMVQFVLTHWLNLNAKINFVV